MSNERLSQIDPFRRRARCGILCAILARIGCQQCKLYLHVGAGLRTTAKWQIFCGCGEKEEKSSGWSPWWGVYHARRTRLDSVRG
jgi:hypothetical protein